MYAWTNFVVDINDWGQTVKSIKPGDEVTQQDLNVSDERWEALIEQGQVREQPYPDVPTGVSPAEYLRHLQAKAAKGKLTAKEVDVLQQRVTPKVEPAENRTVEPLFKLPL